MARDVKEYAGPALKARPRPKVELQLVAVTSDDFDAGEEFKVPPFDPLSIGRSSKGLQLTDPLVSIQHAQVFHDAARGYVVEDLDSATGTWVDEECVRKDSRPIGIGTRLRFGDTVFEVQQVRPTPRWVTWVIGGAGGVVIAAVVLFGLQQLKPPPAPALGCPPSVADPLSVESLEVPESFLRPRGLTVPDLRCVKIADDDYDGKLEAWLERTDGKGAFVVQPDGGDWRVLGELPPGCRPSAAGRVPNELPPLECEGETWVASAGTYRVLQQEGVVVWYRTISEEKAPEAPAPEPGEGPATIQLPGASPIALGELKVGRFSLKGDGLGRFLGIRGVERPVHYVICEEAFDGIKSQALDDEEQVVELRVACISDMRFEGAVIGKPVAMALSPAGRQALIDDVTTFYAGHPDGLFLPPEWEPMLEAMSARPGYLVGATKIVADTKESDAPMLSPIPDVSREIRSAHQLIRRDSRLAAARPATTVPILGPGRGKVDPPGCVVLQTRTRLFTSYGFSALFGGPFLVVEEIGCGEPHAIAEIGHNGGVVDVALPGLDLRVSVESKASTRGLEVARARLSWRERPEN